MIKSIIFDFDGVIIDSVGIKSQVFFDVFKRFGNKIALKVVEYHEENGGVSRFKKFEYINQKYLQNKLNNKDIQIISQNFSKLIKSRIYNAPYINGSIDFLKNNFSKYIFYIATSTPQNEIIEILTNKQIIQFFFKVFGSPLSKSDQIKKILKLDNNHKHEFLFFGDSIEDFEASVNNQIKFIGIKSKYTNFSNVDTITDFLEINQSLKLYSD